MDTFTSYIPRSPPLLPSFRLLVRRVRPVLALLRDLPVRSLAAAMLSAGLGACAGHAGPSPEPRGAAPDPCQLALPPASSPSSLTVVVTAPIEPRRLWLDANPGERFLLSNLYETLVRVDCRGIVRPGLASSWRFDSAGGRWILALREAARFWNGEPAAAGEILGAWRETAQRGGMAAMDRVLAGALAKDERTISIMLGPDSLRVLADPGFLVRRERPGSAWPEGTGPYRPADSLPTSPSPGLAALQSLRLEPMHDGHAPRLAMYSVPVAAARDLVDLGIDLLLTDAPDLISYAASQPGLDSAALDWSRLYLLLTTVPEGFVSPRPGVPEEARVTQREALARDVVRGAARAAQPPYWWGQSTSCMGPPQGAPAPQPSRGAAEIAYDRADPTARALAERLAAVAAMSERGANDASALLGALRGVGSRARAVGLSSAAFADALRTGVSLAYVFDVPARVPGPCLAWDRFLRRAPWIVEPGGSLAGTIVPLVETRWTVLHRPDRLGLGLEWDGTLVLAPLATPVARDR